MATENNIGENIKKCRAKLGLLQEKLAKKSGVKYVTLTKIESNVIKSRPLWLWQKSPKRWAFQ